MTFSAPPPNFLARNVLFDVCAHILNSLVLQYTSGAAQYFWLHYARLYTKSLRVARIDDCVDG